jgi:hypothetical protein
MLVQELLGHVDIASAFDSYSRVIYSLGKTAPAMGEVLV